MSTTANNIKLVMMTINTDTPTLKIELPKHTFKAVSHISRTQSPPGEKKSILTVLRAKTQTINKAIKLASRHHRFLPVITKVHQVSFGLAYHKAQHAWNAHRVNEARVLYFTTARPAFQSSSVYQKDYPNSFIVLQHQRRKRVSKKA